MPPLGQNYVLAGYSGYIKKFDPALHVYSGYKNSPGIAYYCISGDAAGNVIYAGGSFGRLSKSTDGGESWAEITAPAAVDITAIHFISETEVYIFHGWGHGKLYKYDGATFTEVDFVDIYSRVWAIWGTSNDLYTGWFYGAYTPFAIRWWNGSIWQTDTSINGGAQLRIYGGGRLADGSSLVAGNAGGGTCKFYKGTYNNWTLEHSTSWEGDLMINNSENVIAINPNTDVAYILSAFATGCYLYKRSALGVYTTYGPYYTPDGVACSGIALLADDNVVIGAGDESVVLFDGASFTHYPTGLGGSATTRAIWSAPELPPFEITDVSPTTVTTAGGDAIVLTGTWDVGKTVSIFFGPLGTIEDPPCTFGQGHGYSILSPDGPTMTCYVPHALEGTANKLTVRIDADVITLDTVMSAVQRPRYHKIDFIRRSFPPIGNVGSRRPEEEQ